MEAGSVAEKLCIEKHKRVDEQLERINNHGNRLKELETGSEVQAGINKILAEQLAELMEWKKQQDEKPAKRWSVIVNIVIQWAALFILGLLALKMGLQ